jgi:hypothetical protein
VIRKYWQFLGAIVGFILVCIVLNQTGVERVWAALLSASIYFPLILAGEFFFGFFGMLAQRSLYGDDRHLIPWSEFLKAGCVAYAMMGLLPMGRPVGEAARAVLLSKYVGRVKATAIGVQSQVVALLITGLVSVLGALALPNWATIANATLILALALGTLFFGKRFKARDCLKVEPLLLELLGRFSQVIQNGFLVLAVGGAFGIIPALCSESLHLVGATLGDLVPGQLGVTELVYREASATLNLEPEDALSIALLAHMAQLFWVVAALVVNVMMVSQHKANKPHGHFSKPA